MGFRILPTEPQKPDKRPRKKEDDYLAFVRTLPCVICGGPSEAAHLRAAKRLVGKRQCGKSEKPDDKWTLPLCREHHTQQHSMNELEFWGNIAGVENPHQLALALYAHRDEPEVCRRVIGEHRLLAML